jgi:hypothetical protein
MYDPRSTAALELEKIEAELKYHQLIDLKIIDIEAKNKSKADRIMVIISLTIELIMADLPIIG